MLVFNRLNVTLIKSDSIEIENIDIIKAHLKEKYNTDKVTILCGFGKEDKFVVFDEETLNIIISC